MRSRASILIYLALVFLSGVLVGGVGVRLYMVQEVRAVRPRRPSPEEYRQRYMQEMRSRLKLSDEQAQRIEAFLDETRDRFRTQARALQEEQKQHIRAILRPEQALEYEKMQHEREERRRGPEKSHPGC